MKILVLCQYFYPEQFRVNDICFELANEGHEVTVITGLPNYPSGRVESEYKWFRKRKEVINGVKVIRSWLIGRGRGTKRLALNYISFAISATLKSLFINKEFDVILVYQLSPITMALPGILLKKLTRKPLILYCHDLWPESIVAAGISQNSKTYNVLLKLSQWIYQRADEVFVSSRSFEEYLSNTLGVTRKITYLPVYAETVYENTKEVKNSKETLDLLFAGNIGEMQSVETIIKAANELKDKSFINWHIIGDGSSRRKCEELAKQMKLDNVIFYGHHTISEMPSFYELADAFLITLKADKIISYTLPNKVQSYMAAGKPIIGAIDGETKRVINEAQCGLCCAAEDYKELANIVKDFSNLKSRYSWYSQNARKYYDDNFPKEIFMYRLNNLLQDATREDA